MCHDIWFNNVCSGIQQKGFNHIYYFSSDRPQMAHLHKIPSEFSTSRMRDSFIRQFIEQGGDPDLLTMAIGASDNNDEKAEAVLSVPQPNLLSPSKQKSVMATPQKKKGITHIIRLGCYPVFLIPHLPCLAAFLCLKIFVGNLARLESLVMMGFRCWFPAPSLYSPSNSKSGWIAGISGFTHSSYLLTVHPRCTEVLFWGDFCFA